MTSVERLTGRPTCSELLHELQVPFARVLSAHAPQHAGGSALQGQVHLVTDRLQPAHDFDRSVIKSAWMRRGEANSPDPGNGADPLEQIGETGPGMLGVTVAVDRLSEQEDFRKTLIGGSGALFEDGPGRPVPFLASRIRYDAEAALFVAAFHDRNRGTKSGLSEDGLDLDRRITAQTP